MLHFFPLPDIFLAVFESSSPIGSDALLGPNSGIPVQSWNCFPAQEPSCLPVSCLTSRDWLPQIKRLGLGKSTELVLAELATSISLPEVFVWRPSSNISCKSEIFFLLGFGLEAKISLHFKLVLNGPRMLCILAGKLSIFPGVFTHHKTHVSTILSLSVIIRK